MIDLPEFSPSWKFCPARTSREIFCPGPPGIASLGEEPIYANDAAVPMDKP